MGIYILMSMLVCLGLAAQNDNSPRLRHVVSALQEQVVALQKEQQRNRIVIQALESKLDDELTHRSKLLQSGQRTRRKALTAEIQTPTLDGRYFAEAGLQDVTLPAELGGMDLNKRNDSSAKAVDDGVGRLDPALGAEEETLMASIGESLKLLRTPARQDPLDVSARDSIRLELESMRTELQKLRQEVESQKARYREQESQLTEMKSGYITTKWLQKTVGEVRRELSELAAALNISAAIRENQHLELMLDRVRGELSGIRSELDHESAGLAKHAAIVDEMRNELKEVRSMTSSVSADYRQLSEEVSTLREEIFSSSDGSQKVKLWDEGISVEGSGSEGSGTDPYVHSRGLRFEKRHLHREIETVKRAANSLRQSQNRLSLELQALKKNQSWTQSRVGFVERRLEDLDNRTTSVYEDQCLLSKSVDDVRNRLVATEERTLRNGQNIVNITEAMTGMDKVHSSTVQLFEALESLEDDFSVNINELQREISKFEFNVAQVQGSLDILRHDQSSHYQDLKGLKSEFSKLSHEFREDHYRLTVVHNELQNRSLERCTRSHQETLQDLKLANLELQLSKLAQKEEDLKQQTNLMYSKLMGKVDRSVLQSLESAYKNVLEKVQNTSTELGNVSRMHQRLQGEVAKMVRRLPRDCSFEGVPNPAKEYLNGVYLIHMPSTEEAKEVYCDMESGTDRRWTLVQRRTDGTENFFRNWQDYKRGFGDPNKEYWLGNEALHLMTGDRNYTLRIDMWDVFDRYTYAEYGYFKVFSEENQYKLDVGEYSGNASDAMRHHHSMAFSTHDRDNDVSSTHCAMYYSAGWWYQHCQYVNINGRYAIGMTWYDEQNKEWVQLAKVEMKITADRT